MFYIFLFLFFIFKNIYTLTIFFGYYVVDYLMSILKYNVASKKKKYSLLEHTH